MSNLIQEPGTIMHEVLQDLYLHVGFIGDVYTYIPSVYIYKTLSDRSTIQPINSLTSHYDAH